MNFLGDDAENAALEAREGSRRRQKDLGCGVRGSFCVLPPEMAFTALVPIRRNYAVAGARTYGQRFEG